MNARKKHGEAKAIWQILSKSDLNKAAKKYRLLNNVPKGSFKTKKNFDTWAIKNPSKAKNILGFVYRFIDEVLLEHPALKPYIKRAELYGPFLDLYLFNALPTKDSFGSFNTSHCEIISIPTKQFKNKIARPNPGVYIKIGHQSTITDIQKFIEQNKDHINLSLEMARSENDITKLPSLRYKPSKVREQIKTYAKLSTSKLQKLANNFSSSDRSKLIQLIMQKKHNQKVKLDTIKPLVYK